MEVQYCGNLIHHSHCFYPRPVLWRLSIRENGSFESSREDSEEPSVRINAGPDRQCVVDAGFAVPCTRRCYRRGRARRISLSSVAVPQLIHVLIPIAPGDVVDQIRIAAERTTGRTWSPFVRSAAMMRPWCECIAPQNQGEINTKPVVWGAIPLCLIYRQP